MYITGECGLLFFHVRSDIEDPQLPDAITADRPVTYEIVEQGSKQRFKKLVSSDGFAYTIKVNIYLLIDSI